MKELTCEQICQAAMAQMDGQLSILPAAQIDAHLKQCTGCRQTMAEIEQGMAGAEALASQVALDDLWPAIANGLAAQPVPQRRSSWLFAMLLILCVGIRAGEIWFPLAATYWLIPVAILMVVAFLALLPENPFAINTQLIEKGSML